MTTCPTCGGADGAHYLSCIPNRLAGLVLDPLLHRLLGRDYRWAAPRVPDPLGWLEARAELTAAGPAPDEDLDPAAVAAVAAEAAAEAAGEAAGEAREAAEEELDAALQAGERLAAEVEQLRAEQATAPTEPAPEPAGPVLEAARLVEELTEQAAADVAEAVEAVEAEAAARAAERATTRALALAPDPAPAPRLSPVKAARAKELEELRAALDLFVAEHVRPAEVSGPPVEFPAIVAAYDAWRPHLSAPPLGGTKELSNALTRAGHDKRRQARRSDTAPDGRRYDERGKPMLYFGVVLTPVAPAETAPAAEPAEEPHAPADRPADRNAEQVAELRELMAAVKRDRGPRIERPGYDGDLPGRELKSAEHREVILRVIDLNPGWRYEGPGSSKGGGQGGKPRLVAPDGRFHPVPLTPSDRSAWRLFRSDLRRMGAAV